MKKQSRKKDNDRVYAEGFGPNSKLVELFKTPIPPKTAGVFSLLLAACLIVFSSISAFTLFFPARQLDRTAVIQADKVQTIKNSPVVAGGPAIKWVVLVSKSHLTSNQYLLKLPKNAKNIKLTPLSPQQAEAVVAQAKVNQQTQLTMEERKQLAAASKPSSFFTAGLLSRINRFFLSSVEDGVDQLVEAIFQPEVVDTPEAKLVNLSKQVEKEQKKEAKQEVKEEKQAAKEAPAPEQPAVEEPPVEESEPMAETPAVPVVETASPSNQEVIVPPQETPISQEVPAAAAEVVQVEYETPAPTISEQETDTGKLVTVSSDAAEVNCESLKPAGQVSVLSYIFNNSLTASLSSAISNFLSAISKFLFADLEQAVSDAVETVLDQIIPPAEEAPQVEETATAEEAPAPVEEQPLAEAPSLIETVSPSDQPAVGTPPPAQAEAQSAAEAKAEQAYQQCLASQTPLTDVLAFTTIPEIYNVGQENRIRIKWKNNGNQEVAFSAFDTDNNGKLDYVEWTVPHLSDQVFEIIFISKAFELDENQNIIADIYDTVSQQDGNYATVPANNYVRVTFEQILDNTKDITIYARPTAGLPIASIEVYPVYTDADGNQTQGPKLDLAGDGANPDFSSIDHDGKYRILLKNLDQPTDVFDLKIVQ